MATKKVTMSVTEYIQANEKITRKEVYKMIKEGKLKATKVKGAYVIEITEKKKATKKYTVKEFVEEYNKKHVDCVVTEKKVRELASKEIITAEKVSGKWVIMESPSKRLKLF